VILSCLSAPFRLLGLAVLAGILYLGWVNRDEVRRQVHRLTADAPAPSDALVPPEVLRKRGKARLDSLATRRADSVVLTPPEVAALVMAEVERRAGEAADSIGVELLEGAVAIRGTVDAAKLPKSALGPLSEWVTGRQAVEVRGPLTLLRVGTGQWRIDRVTVRGIPLPEKLWQVLLGTAGPGGSGSLTFPVDQWITGFRVTPRGAILYGNSPR